jgi:hypothetical protein
LLATVVPVSSEQDVVNVDLCLLDKVAGVKQETVAVPVIEFVWQTFTKMLETPSQINEPALNTWLFNPAESGVKLAWVNTVVTGVVSNVVVNAVILVFAKPILKLITVPVEEDCVVNPILLNGPACTPAAVNSAAV